MGNFKQSSYNKRTVNSVAISLLLLMASTGIDIEFHVSRYG